ncbi:MAG: DUF4135 domain-containing protein [Acutalibacteraceae bacterium]|nr:DUF4135 domain-containing protein [Acutalibacteraceae bacterium]
MKETFQLGDSHFGRFVELVKDGENKYIIKPRSGLVEKAFEAFLSELKQGGFPHIPECEHILEQNGESFKSEYVKNAPAESDRDIELYFKRCGSLIFLTYILCSNDLHCENIIACKNSPVIVDSETLINGLPDKPKNTLKNLISTVTASQLLPIMWQFENDAPIQASGFLSNRKGDKNTLFYNNAPCYIYDHIEEVCEGFNEIYEYSLNNKNILLSALNNFEGCFFRILLRPTEVYSRMLALAEKFPEAKRKYILESLLSAAYKKDVRKDRFEYMHKAFEAEANSLLNGDIPHFSIKFDKLDLFSGESIVADKFLQLSPKSCVHERIFNLSEDDRIAQIKIIKQSLQSSKPIEQYSFVPIIGNNIVKSSFDLLENGYISALSSGWIQIEAASDNNVYLQNAGFGLYNGLIGILCAYAALYHKTGEKKYLNTLIAHYEPFSRFIDTMNASIPLNDSVGRLQDGLGGIINALFHIWELTKEDIFRSDAINLAKKIVPIFNGESAGDILGDVAGISLMLPKLPGEIALPFAKTMSTIISNSNPSLTGAAHGAAGIALAAACVQKVLNSNELEKKIIDLLRFEEKFFDIEKNNWQDLRYTDKIAFMNGWCSGAGGEAMIRKRILSLTDNETIKNLCMQDINRAAENLKSNTVLKRDSLCCGNSSRLMALSCLGVQNNDLYTTIEKRFFDDNLCFVHILDTCDVNYGLMQGISGVCYALIMYGNELSGGMLL